METLGPTSADSELNLLTQWGDPESGTRTRKAAVVSVVLHIFLIAVLAVLPEDFLTGGREAAVVRPPRIVTPLTDPLTEFTQKGPNKGKVAKELDVESLQARNRIQAPKGSPSTTREMAPRPAEIPTPIPPKPELVPEPPKLEATAREAPKLDLPVAPVPAPPLSPQIQTVEKPHLALENVPGAPPPVPQQTRIPIPNSSVQEALRQSRQFPPGGGLMVGDPGAGPGGVGEGLNLPPSPGVQGSALELKSDPMGVDFRPYLTQILATIRRNWYAVMPESVHLGRRGKVGVLFAIVTTGKVSKVSFSFQSGSDPLDRAAIAAISASNPLPPLPPEFKGDRIVLQLNFAYNIPRQ